MPTPLRVLIAEDRPTDAELMLYELRRAGFEPKWKRVETEAAYLEELQTAPDIILADHTLPQFNAPRALELLKESNLDVPIIVVTGSISEEVAVERIKQGAADYILKDRMTRLGEAVKRALEEKRLRDEKRQAAAALQTRYQELRTLHEITQTILGSLDLKGILEKILDMALAVGCFDLGVIRLLDRSGDFLETMASRGYRDPQDVPSHHQRTLDATTGRLGLRVLTFKETYVEEDVQGCDGLRTFKREGIRSAVVVPVRAENQALGVIQLGCRAPRKFQVEEIRLCEAMGNQMGVAIQKARLHEETKRSLDRIRALHEIDLAITSTLELRMVLEFLLDRIGLFLPKNSATTIRLLNKESGLLEPVACRNLNEAVWKTREAGRGFANVVFETKTPLMVHNVQADPRTRDREFFARYGLVSYLGVPLMAKREILGVLGFYTKNEHQFTDEEVEFLKTLAGQAAIAINNAQLYEKIDLSKRELELTNQHLEKSLKQLSSFYTALAPLTPSESIHDTMSGIIERLMEATGADAGLIRIWDKEADIYRIVGQRGFPDYYLKQVGTSPPGGAADWVVKTGETIIAPDIALEPRLKGKIQRQLGLFSCAMLPLKVRNEVRGIIHLASRKLGYFDEEQKDHLIAISQQMTIALENRELFDNLKASRDDLERANAALKEGNQMLSALHAVAAAASQSLNLDRILQAAIEKITEIFRFDATQIHIYNEQMDELLLRAAFESDPARFTAARSFKKGQGIVGKVAETGEPLIFEDVQTDPLYQQLSRSKTSGQFGYHFFAVLPIKGRLKNLGTIACVSIASRKLSSGEIQLLEGIADQMAVAIENNELYEDVKQKVQELEQKTAELERANKVKDEFLSVMSHELRTPLNVVTGYAGMIQDKMLGEINPKQAEACTKIMRRTNDLLGMVNSILYATSLETNEVKADFHEVNLNNLFAEFKSTYDTTLVNQLVLTWDCPPDLPILRTDGPKLKQVLENLINNAVKFTDKGSVTIAAKISGEQTHTNGQKSVEFIVADTGIGISKEKLPMIFDKFRQVDSSETRLYGGVGLGLYIVKKFTELLDGTVEVQSEPGKGSTFTLKIPVGNYVQRAARANRNFT